MSNRLRRWVFRVAIWTIAIFGIGLLGQQSKAFTNCIHDRKNSKEYKSLHERGITPRNPRQTRPARSRDRAELLGQFEQTDLRPDDLLFLCHIVISVPPAGGSRSQLGVRTAT